MVPTRTPTSPLLPALGLAVLGAVALGPRPLLVAVLWLAFATPVLVTTDLVEHRLPDAVTLPGYAVAVAAVLADAVAGAVGPAAALVAGVTAVLLFWTLHLVAGLGFGDVKLAGVLALIAGALGPDAPVTALVVAFLVGGVAAITALLRSGRGTRLPFGPSLLVGAWTALLFH